jgi:hypothetical protein
MHARNRLALVAATGLTCTGLLTAPATAGPPSAGAETPATVTVLAKGLEGPRQLSQTEDYLYVAESDAGQVSRVTKKNGALRLQVSGAVLAQGVVRTGGRFYIASGEAAPDAPDARAVKGGSEVLVAKTGHKPRTFADLLAYELEHNPDNQTQLGADGRPLDALSNPYYVIKSKAKGGFLLAADAGGNDVLAISKKGTVSTFFVPPSVASGVCGDAENNSDAGPSCDAVPTGLAYGPGGNLYVSALTSEAPGEGRVYVVDKNGKLLRTLTGFSAPTGVAVGPDGSVYVSELLQGAPEESATVRGAAAPDLTRKALVEAAGQAPFDPTTIGQIVKVAPDASRTYAQVTMPSGLLWADGRLYASAWSIAGLLGIPDAGQVVSVEPGSFVAQCGAGSRC